MHDTSTCLTLGCVSKVLVTATRCWLRPAHLKRALAPAIALNACYGTPTPIETTAVRRIAALDSLLAITVVAATAAVAVPVAAGWISSANGSVTESAVRNLVSCTGLALIGRTFLGNHASTVIPTLLALTVSVFGYGPEQAAHWWAWPAAHPSDMLPWASSTALLIIGLYRTAQTDFPTAPEQHASARRSGSAGSATRGRCTPSGPTRNLRPVCGPLPGTATCRQRPAVHRRSLAGPRQPWRDGGGRRSCSGGPHHCAAECSHGSGEEAWREGGQETL